VSLCDLEPYLCPRAVLRKGVAEGIRFASSRQVRGRGSTRCTVDDHRQIPRSRSGRPINGAGPRDMKPMHSSAFPDAQ
jgi:hypothetical protein